MTLMDRRRIMHIRVRVLFLLVSSVLLLVTFIAPPYVGETVRNLDAQAILHDSAIPASDNMLNVTHLWEEIWSSVSSLDIENYTRTISQNYPNRTWSIYSLTPSTNLENAWHWANQTLQEVTSGALTFRQITDHQSLIATQYSVDPEPKAAVIITGIIDSDESPGANDAGASVAVVLEMADVLSSYSLGFDIHYVLINRGYENDEYDQGSRYFVEWLEENEIVPLTTLAFERLLFQTTQYAFGTKMALRTSPYESIYQRSTWVPELMMRASKTAGSGLLLSFLDLELTERSTAYEMWQGGYPALHISQGFWHEGYSGTAGDLWDVSDYLYTKAKEAAASAICAITYIGQLKSGDVAAEYRNGYAKIGEDVTLPITVSVEGFVNVTLIWEENTTFRAQLRDSSDQLVYQRIESDNKIVAKYRALVPGPYDIIIKNIGSDNSTFTLNVAIPNDCDGDGMTNIDELNLGTSMYLLDTDADGLNDDFELSIGGDPTSADSDGDGALDYDEYMWGSSLQLNDTDGDGILDGMEAELGSDPTLVDTDGDGLDDWNETYSYLTSSVSSDTDSDGLEDGFEVSVGLNPLSPDSDGDGLSDLFEFLNFLNPLSNDTDGDGWSDAYEVEFCMSPTSADTDGDGIPDGIDWDPQEHWVSAVVPLTLLAVVLLVAVFSFLKYKVYTRPE
ncbi:MAG: M28 family peptidase [Candidatus Thorarchaeota archaeon]